MIKYDAFISYKRQGGSVWASLVRAILSQKLIPYMDVHDIRGGKWSPQLEEAIQQSYRVIMVLYRGIETTISEEDDVFVHEIKYANELGKIIVPFYSDDCNFNYFKDKPLPYDIQPILNSMESKVVYNKNRPEETYSELFNQIDSKLLLRINNIGEDTEVNCKIDNNCPEEFMLKNVDKRDILIERNFSGRICLTFHHECSDICAHVIYICLNKEDSNRIQNSETMESCFWEIAGEHGKGLVYEYKYSWKQIIQKRNMNGQMFPNQRRNNFDSSVFNYDFSKVMDFNNQLNKR